jgi:hypothetical protein
MLHFPASSFIFKSNDADTLAHTRRMPSMGKTFAMFTRFCVHDIDGHVVNDVEPARVHNATSQLNLFHLRTPGVLDAGMV